MKKLYVAVLSVVTVLFALTLAASDLTARPKKRQPPPPPNGVDLVVVFHGLYSSCSVPCPECTPMKQTFSVKNQGNQPSTVPVTVQAFRQNELVRSYTVPPLAAGQMVAVGKKVKRWDCCGTQHMVGNMPPNITVKVDTGNAVAEHNETNNVGSGGYEVHVDAYNVWFE